MFGKNFGEVNDVISWGLKEIEMGHYNVGIRIT